MTFIEYILLFLSVIIGGGVAFFLRNNTKEGLRLFLSFSGAYVLGITVLHLMPNVFSGQSASVGLYVLLGFFIQLVLEQFSGGVEHGHLHAAKDPKANFAVSVMLGLCIHAFIEGMPLGIYDELYVHKHGEAHNHGHNHLLLGIILHKAPAAFALVLLLLMSGFKQKTVLICLFIFAAMSPLGGLMAEYLSFSYTVQQAVLAVVLGSFLHISTTIIFEADGGGHSISFRKLAAIVGGIFVSLFTLL